MNQHVVGNFTEGIIIKTMNILVACEFSGTVRRAFADMGHSVTSCDLMPDEGNIIHPWEKHYQGNVFDLLTGKIRWDMMIAHPPCTHLAASGARWWSSKVSEQREALDFVNRLMSVNIPKICIENPVGKIGTAIRKPDQIIQPWQFGHGETKSTCLWLKGLPELQPTNVVSGRSDRIHKMPGGKLRWKKRSITYKGIADAMAQQWGIL